MNNIIKKIFAIAAALTLLPAIPAVHAETSAVTVTLDPSEASPFNGGRFEGWGTSLCWWANRLGYSEKMTEQAAELFFSEDGLGLDIARYNLGGGDDPSHNHITRSDSKIPGYAVGMNDDGGIIYDWSADENQRNIALAALKANPDLYFEGFSNSPPYFMTNSGCTSGAGDAGSNNLRDDMYDDFARFIAETTKHFKDEFGIEFKSYSPMNEPDTTYWGKNSPKQEGCHFDSGESESKMIVETRNALDAAGLGKVLVAGMDETSIDTSLKNLDLLSGEALKALGRIDTHTYGGSKRAELKDKAFALGKTLWMSEVDDGGTAGTNAGDMGAGLNLANRIVLDMNGMQPAAWVLWDIVDFHRDSKFYHTVNGAPEYTEKDAALKQDGGLWGVGMGNHDTENIELSQKYYVFGQFTRYIDPGDTIIASSDRTLAAYNKDTGSIKIVAVNTKADAVDCTFDLSAFNKMGEKAKIIRTSGSFENGEHWADAGEERIVDKKFTAELVPNSVTTFVIENKISDAGFLTVKGSDLIDMNKAQYTAFTSDGAPVAWSVSDPETAEIDMNGTLTPKKEGIVTVTAASPSLNTSNSVNVRILDAAVIEPYDISGSPSWNNNASTSCLQVADGDPDTYFDGLANGYVTLDLGDDYEIASIAYAPRKNYEYRMIDSYFEGSKDGENWTKLCDVTGSHKAGELTYVFDENLTDGSYRYIRYTVPEGKQSYSGSEQDYACNIAEIEIRVTGEKSRFADVLSVINPGGEIYGNINMPSSVNGANITWTSSDESVVTKTGEVTRGSVDTNVTLTASAERGGESIVKEYAVMVKAKPADLDETNAYLRVSYKDVNDNANREQVYFEVSKNGKAWKTLNDLAPVLVSGVGERGIHDPRMIRSPEGDRFFLIAADYSGYSRRNDTEERKGSGAVVVWESNDLVNWSYPRLVKVTREDVSGEPTVDVYYDNGTGSYVVSLSTSEGRHVYGTRDFRSFTELTGFKTELFADREELKITADEYNALVAAYVPKEQLGYGDIIFESDGGELAGKDFIKLENADGSNILKGLDEFTVSFDSTANAQSWWFYAAPNDDAQVFQSEKYVGILDSGSKITAERYNSNNEARPAAAEGAYTKGGEKHITAVYGKSSVRLYIDGMLAGKADSDVDISDLLGDDPVIYIGKANWGTGEYSNGAIDNFKIYDCALTADQVYYETNLPKLFISGTGNDGGEKGKIVYNANTGNAYICVYDMNNKIIALASGNEGVIENLAPGEYKVTAYLWDDGMQPLSYRTREIAVVK